MSTESFSVRSVFDRAVEISSDAEQQAFLDRACAGAPDLRQQVDALLRAYANAGSFLETPGVDRREMRPVDRIAEGPGTVIGPYTLLEQIGEGGFGVVFMAEQAQPIQRTTALKIIKPGMDTRQVIARFEAERQALAMMDHPNIARVIDADTTATGRPYFVMDLVKGVPITTYCDEQMLSVRQRLELFIQLCHAVQHAHQKGIIHRDLKPSNVLAAEYDGRPVPKIIDFGVAKATARRLTERTMFTEYGQLIGTFEYMSPEQARFNQLDVDTRSDIYSLGVLLYELLIGSTPFDRRQFETVAFDETLRIIREEDPPKPSTRLSQMAWPSWPGPTNSADQNPANLPGPCASATIAANRGVEPRKLISLLRGELDWIVMKCLDKDRNRRYESAGGLAADVERYLHDEPVQACPPSATYRFRKFARRNKTLLAAGSAIAAALVLGLGLSTWMYFRAATERDRAKSVSEFLQWSLASNDADEVEAIVRRGIDIDDEQDQKFEGQPAAEAELATSYAWLANFLATTGRQDKANAVVRKAADHLAHAAKSSLAPWVHLKALYYLAIAQLRLRDEAGYREACAALLHVPSDDDDDKTQCLWICCLGPHPGEDLSVQINQAQELAAKHSANNYSGSKFARWIDLGVVGGLLYRADQYEQAAQPLEESVAAYPDDALRAFRTALDRQLLLAMTRWQLGRREEARRLLAETQPDLDEWLQKPTNTWMRRAEIELLRREAEALIEPKEADKAVDNKTDTSPSTATDD